jgi:DNA polymerase-3 subunit epsilon
MSEDRYVVIDAETSGLFRWGAPADAEGQPRLAHLTMIGLHGDRIWFKANAYVKPDGWSMPPELERIHGLTDAILNEKGVPILDVVTLYAWFIDAGYVVVAFNAAYDLKVMRGELRRAGLDDRARTTPSICTMIPCVGLCKLPYPSGREGYKFPKLREAMEYFGLEQKGAHTALGDAESCLSIFRALRERGIVLNPALMGDAS